jgi:hypothetical protein
VIAFPLLVSKPLFAYHKNVRRCVSLCIYGSTTHCGHWLLFQFFNLYTQSVGPLGGGISPSQGRYPYTQEHKHRIKTHIHQASGGIRTQDPSVSAGEDSSCLRPRGHCDRPYVSFLFLWLYSLILDLGRLNLTFRFISVTISRTVGRTPWTGDQLVARPLLTARGDCDDEVGAMNCFGRVNRSTRRKLAPTPLCSPQIPLARPGREPAPPRWETSA